ncbi:sumo-activating enzyme subunit 2 [Nannochloropsis gaditana]|uniref:Sumo-activating enzyme subunit 2 n=1 Tax=Nannochloropsis gaditana TaxID=72520 RepID=W7TP04_9STRA|nr:sumo-activating enzyme subunit 2 [Nannochloropsis gaditana]
MAASSPSTSVDDARTRVLGPALAQAVREAKLLVVGAGGIGCELLKNLVLTGFEKIEVIDLDTIDVSNLNRQFLFRAEHVGQPKAVVAKEVVLSLNPRAAKTLVAHHANVKDPQFNMEYFKQFTLVLNALDNIDARRHVNRMCLATGKAMIDAGTTGYVGQVNKVYPICTIRSTPDKPVHCVVWAKEAYKLLFGAADASLLYEAPDAPEPSLYMPVVLARPEGEGREAAVRYGFRVLKALFYDELSLRVDRGVYAGARVAPCPVACLGDEGKGEEAWVALVEDGGEGAGEGQEWTREVWTEERCVLELLDVFAALVGDPGRRRDLGRYDFDKDDALAMRFVTAATNLRAASFGIPAQSYHDAKGIAGNIVPAIATTNAIAAGLQVLEALKILRTAPPSLPSSAPPSLPSSTIVDAGCRVNYIVRTYAGRKRLLLQPTSLHPPNPACFVCNRSSLDVVLDTEASTLSFLVEKVLKGSLSFAQPTITLRGTSIIYEEGEDADETMARRNLPLALASLPAGGIRDQSTVEVDDVSQDLTLHLHVYHKRWEGGPEGEGDAEAPPEGFLLGGSAKEALKAAAAAAAAQATERQRAQHLYAAEEEVKTRGRPGLRVLGPMIESMAWLESFGKFHLESWYVSTLCMCIRNRRFGGDSWLHRRARMPIFSRADESRLQTIAFPGSWYPNKQVTNSPQFLPA